MTPAAARRSAIDAAARTRRSGRVPLSPPPRTATRLHAAVYRLSGGRVGARVAGQPVLLLETVGRRSGRRRTSPVQYLANGDGYVIVAANGGAPRPPAWWFNLDADPRARVTVGADTFAVRARTATGEERHALWQQLTAVNRHLERTATAAGRELPVVVLNRTSAGQDTVEGAGRRPDRDGRSRIVCSGSA